MDELLRQNMSELVALLTSMLQNGLDQMPTLFAQVLAYGMFHAKLYGILGIVFIAISLVLFALFIWNEDVQYNDALEAGCTALGIIFIVTGVIMVALNVPDIWAINNTPELFVFHRVMMYL
jgi:H+/Cl- antiporter ClcA